MKKITVTLPLDLLLEIASYGSNGKISETSQRVVEKVIKDMGYEDDLNILRNKKLLETSEHLRRILGSDVISKLDDSLKIARDAIQVASRMNEKN